jgi:hypothetical protein
MPATRKPPRCKGKTKKGTPCKAHPLKGTDRCLAHSDAETRASVGFVAEAGHLGGRPAIPKPTELGRRLVEDNIVAVQRPYWRALGYDVVIDAERGPVLAELEGGGAKLYGTSKSGVVNVSKHDDLGAMITASEKLQDRAFGRPKQTTALTGGDGGPIEIVDVRTDRGARVAELLAGTRAVA